MSIFDEVKLEHVKGDTCVLKVFDTEIAIKNGEVSIKPKKTTIEVDGDAVLETSGNTTIQTTGKATNVNVKAMEEGANVNVEAKGNVIVKGANVNIEATTAAEVKAKQLTVKGTAAPVSTGGPFCGIPNCLFTGASHCGNVVTGTEAAPEAGTETQEDI